jgi:hypothetical protein
VMLKLLMQHHESGEPSQVDFERFDQRHIAIAGSPFVTIQKGGRVMTINRPAYEMLGSPEAVELLYNKKNRVVGIREVSKKEPYAFPLRAQGRKGREPSNYLVAVQAFTKHYNIDTSVAMRYPAEMQEDILTISLDRGTIATGPRAKSKDDE